LQKELYPEFSVQDLINLPDYSIYLKLMIDGVVSTPFSEIASALIITKTADLFSLLQIHADGMHGASRNGNKFKRS
jgi:hypothetical protein